jgi:hypothetical protein
MPRVWFEPTTPVFEQAKIVHALDRTATVISDLMLYHDSKIAYKQHSNWLVIQTLQAQGMWEKTCFRGLLVLWTIHETIRKHNKFLHFLSLSLASSVAWCMFLDLSVLTRMRVHWLSHTLSPCPTTAPPFLTSALDGGEWSDSRPDRFSGG